MYTSREIFDMRDTERFTEFRLVQKDLGITFYTDAVTRAALYELFDRYPLITEFFPKLTELQGRVGPKTGWETL